MTGILARTVVYGADPIRPVADPPGGGALGVAAVGAGFSLG